MAGMIPATSAAAAAAATRTLVTVAATKIAPRAAAARAIPAAAGSQQQECIRAQHSFTARHSSVLNTTYNYCVGHNSTSTPTSTNTSNATSTTTNPTPTQGLTRTQQQRAYGSNTFNTATNTTNHTPRQAQQQRSYGSTPLVTDASTVDLRSDTVTLPCQRLRAAMAGAKVGDDVFGEDPTVKRLEECVAMLLGKERGLFVPSGSMANLIAVGVHCRRGDELILGNKSHLFLYEAASASAFMGVGFHTLSNLEDGGLDLDGIAGAIRDEDQHFPRSSLLCLENTQNYCGAVAISADRTAEMAAVARRKGLKVHVDGARLWNAAVALDVRPSELVTSVDTVSVCLSKGLGAPVGSVLVGSAEFIAEAHRMRKALGGGMRQAGVIAAAGLEAVVNNYTRLQEDHDNAAALASGLAALPGVRTKTRGPSHTNAVYFEVAGITGEALQSVLDTLERDHGVLMLVEIGGIVRAMTNLGVNKEGVERAVEATGIVLAATQATQQ